MQVLRSQVIYTIQKLQGKLPYLLLVLLLVTSRLLSASSDSTINKNLKGGNTAPRANHVYGVLWDEETHEPVAYANIFYKGTALGIYTDFEGQFDLGYRPWPSDTIEIVYMGYETIKIALDTVKSLPLQIYFKRKIERTEGASIRLGINPAMIWVNLAQKNRDYNSPDRINSYECEVFSKTTVAINNISKNLKKTKLATEVGAYFDTISYLTGDSNKAILPVLFSEVLSDFSFQRNPRLSKELVKATRIRGIGVTDGTFIGQMMGNTFTNYNIYDESLVVLDKGIPTPISPGAELIYDYKLVNVDKLGPRRLFQIQVTPKNPRDLALSGFIWIEDTSGAIVRLSVEITGASNLNYVEKLKFSQEYIPTETGAYFCTKARVMIDIGELSEQAAGMVATNVLSCKNMRFGMDFPPRFFDNRIQIAPEANLQTDSFWLKNAHIKQSAEEARISSKIDTLNNLPRVKSYIDLVNFLVDGYQRVGKIDLGPYFTLASWNPYEGFRMKMGFRTTPAISKNMQTTGFLAYGFRDKAYKYGLKSDIILNRTYFTKLTLSHTYDTELIGLTDNELYAQSLFTAFNLFGSNNITLVRQSKINLGTDLRPGLRVNMGAFHGMYNFPYVKNYRFAYYSNYPDTTQGGISNKITNAHISFRLFYEPKSYDIRTDYDRMTFSAGGPKYSLYLQQGIKGLLGSQYNYTKVQLGYIYDQTWSIMGRSIFGIDYNQVFGLLPYPLLTVYVGNQSFMYSQNAYNQMRIFEFVSDKSLQLSFEHHFNGYIMNRIPLLNHFKLREVVSTKAIYGTLQERNRQIIPQSWEGQPITQFKTFDKKPYWEIGVGIENIFKCIRIDLIWRMTYLEPNSGRNVGVKASFAMYF
jgi:hypothetical protein